MRIPLLGHALRAPKVCSDVCCACAELAGGEVRRAEIISRAGGTLRIENPWGEVMSVNGEVRTGKIVEIETRPGDVLRIGRQPPAAG